MCRKNTFVAEWLFNLLRLTGPLIYVFSDSIILCGHAKPKHVIQLALHVVVDYARGL